MKPKLSVVITPTHKWEVQELTVSSLENQTVVDTLEFLLVCSSLEGLQFPPNWTNLPFRVIEVEDKKYVHELRTVAVREATGDYVVLVEDHVHLSPDWCAELLARTEEGWAAIGGAVQPGGRRTAISEAMFLMTYGEWFQRDGDQVNAPLSGHNTAYHRELLLKLDNLEEFMACPALMQALFRSSGEAPLFTSRVKIRHWDPAQLGAALKHLWTLGKCLGTLRTAGWSPPLRWAFSLAFPAVAAKHWLRGVLQLLRLSSRGKAPWKAAPCMLLLAGVWGLGEAYGSIKPHDAYFDQLSGLEVNRWRYTRKPDLPYDPW
ncbi:MAG: glycosyltransferase [Candidatus Eremiobacteraeota bacterium]|nr:glycosyltransferase [Candidatus Eremiobacteraeota bacterium]